jgi:hypothetical protein
VRYPVNPVSVIGGPPVQGLLCAPARTGVTHILVIRSVNLTPLAIVLPHQDS